jgi:hypothetical protein
MHVDDPVKQLKKKIVWVAWMTGNGIPEIYKKRQQKSSTCVELR